MSVTAENSIKSSYRRTGTNTAGAVTDVFSPSTPIAGSFTDGSDPGEADKTFSRQLTLAISTPVTWDLSALPNALGTNDAFTGVRKFLLQNLSATHPLTYNSDATDPLSFLPASGVLPPGGVVFLVAPLSTGFPVVANDSDLLKLDPGANAVEYLLEIVGF